MADNGETEAPAAPEEQTQQSEAEAAPSGTGRQHNSDSWVVVENPDDSKPTET